MKILFIIFLSLIGINLLAQKERGEETLSPLKYNHVLLNSNTIGTSKNVDGMFVYQYDTIKVPNGKGLFDDFTTNKFKPADAQPGDPEVSDTSWFHLYRAGIPDTMGTEYMSDTTYYILIDTVVGYGFDSLVSTYVPFPSYEVTVLDICTYPPTVHLDTLWPNAAYIDSIWPSSVIDIPFKDPSPDFEQDSVKVYKVATSILDTGYLWVDQGVYRNNTYAVNPPSYGVATFDGLDYAGYPYNFTTTAQGDNDYLTSVPLDLAVKEDGTTPWLASDSLELSFWYQPQGIGNEPEASDSLVLQFWSPTDNDWSTVWVKEGAPLDTFRRASLKIISTNYLRKGFQFRFVNYGAQNGSLDHWHLDFIQLKSNAINDETLQEIAIQNPVNTMLKEYTAMPWTHYKDAPDLYMLDSVNLDVVNSWTLAVSANTAKYDVSESSIPLTTVFADNATYTVPAGGKVSIPIDVYQDASWFVFDTAVSDTSAFFDVDFNFTGGVFLTKSNETFSLRQRFSNYYAYDDGTAEAAYGITGTQPKLAYRFNSAIADSLYAIKIHFEPSVNDVSVDPFILMVWDNTGAGGTPGNVIYEEPLLVTPEYNLGVNGFYTYELSEKVPLSGSYYVGWKQTTTSRLNVGFDKNIDHQDKIYYNVSGTWANTSYQGALMIRPLFSAAQPSGWVGLKEESFDMKLYPNPTSSILQYDISRPDTYACDLIDLNGSLVRREWIGTTGWIDLSDLQSGLYLLKVSDKRGNFKTIKVIKE